jgi:adenine-specific DNA-methyltransferase
MEKLDGQSMNIVNENIEKLKEIFPEVFSEDKIDFEKLQEELGNFTDTDNERYNFTWNGKQEAKKIAQTPSTGTLRPCKEESKNFDTTQNLYIEGDNLEVLKLLQKSYHKKVKMIYIDPPYNTGKDFVYKDNFKDNIKNYLEQTDQVDSDGNRLSTNSDTSGRYHSDWLSMMYPRLKLARNLLKDDGVIFISIDDNEVNNLKKLSDEIFGEDNFINIISAKMKNIAGASGGGEDKRLKKNIEYILIYAKNYEFIKPFNPIYTTTEITELIQYYKNNDISWKYTSVLYYSGDKEYVSSTVDGSGDEIKIFRRINPIYKSVGQLIKEENKSEKEIYYKYIEKIFTTAMPQSSIRVRVLDEVSKQNELSDLYSIEYVPRSGKNKGKVYEQFYKGDKLRLITWLKDVVDIQKKSIYKKDLKGTFWDGFNLNNLSKEGDVKYENGKKPLSLLTDILTMCSKEDDLILDFFSGSATTAHAVIDSNYRYNKNCKFITVQLPEMLNSSKKEEKELCEFLESIKKPKILTELGKERIRRAGDKIVEESGKTDLDTGFKVLKLDSSNIREWDSDFDNLADNLLDSVDNIKEDRTSEDLLYEILLKYGLDLTLPIEEKIINDKKVFIIGFGALVVCLDNDIDIQTVEKIAELKKTFIEEYGIETTRVVFKDSSFKDAVVKTNAIQVLQQFDIDEVVSV